MKISKFIPKTQADKAFQTALRYIITDKYGNFIKQNANAIAMFNSVKVTQALQPVAVLQDPHNTLYEIERVEFESITDKRYLLDILVNLPTCYNTVILEPGTKIAEDAMLCWVHKGNFWYLCLGYTPFKLSQPYDIALVYAAKANEVYTPEARLACVREVLSKIKYTKIFTEYVDRLDAYQPCQLYTYEDKHRNFSESISNSAYVLQCDYIGTPRNSKKTAKYGRGIYAEYDFCFLGEEALYALHKKLCKKGYCTSKNVETTRVSPFVFIPHDARKPVIWGLHLYCIATDKHQYIKGGTLTFPSKDRSSMSIQELFAAEYRDLFIDARNTRVLLDTLTEYFAPDPKFLDKYPDKYFVQCYDTHRQGLAPKYFKA